MITPQEAFSLALGVSIIIWGMRSAFIRSKERAETAERAARASEEIRDSLLKHDYSWTELPYGIEPVAYTPPAEPCDYCQRKHSEENCPGCGAGRMKKRTGFFTESDAERARFQREHFDRHLL